MSDRYFGKVVAVNNEYQVVINKGSAHGVQDGQRFIIVGLGDVLVDPDTGEELEKLEIVRGRAIVVHVQSTIATLKSCDFQKNEDVREIKKIKASRALSLALLGEGETITESIKPGDKYLMPLEDAAIGDMAIRL
jgi:hypothetical protein